MNLNKLKERWQALDASLKLNPQANDVIARCRTRLRQFRAGLLLSDILEIGTGLAMVWVWMFPFAREFPRHKPLMYLGAVAILFVCVFLAGARVLRHRNAKPTFVSVSDELRRQLYAVNQRIWLLRNVIWWYLAPGALAILTVLIAAGIEAKNPRLDKTLLNEGIYAACCLLLFIGIYYLNQRAVRKYLLPLKEDIEKTLHDIEDEADPSVQRPET